MTAPRESAFTFACGPDRLVGIAHLPGAQNRFPYGVIILVGGPQYRVGPHRQYVHLARHLSRQSIAAMRFDFRGIGDSEGDYPGFQALRPDIDAAISAFEEQAGKLDGIVLWGLCEAASSILLDGALDPRVKGAVLLNPWVRDEKTLARTHLKHYYLRRFLSADLWRRVFGGKASLAMLSSLWATVKGALRPEKPAENLGDLPFPRRMAEGLQGFGGKVLLVQSGHDFVAREFDDLVKADPAWQCLKRANVERFDFKESDHTFSTEAWRQIVADKTAAWVKSLIPAKSLP
jgi:exosortase A-associated hydrolase 1